MFSIFNLGFLNALLIIVSSSMLVCLIVIQSNFDYAAGNVFVMKRSYHICETLYNKWLPCILA
jgi:hypothetical protein